MIALAFHVDYWNYLGWRDPFSSPQWSARQAAYAAKMRLSGPYTPQVVIGGELQTVGSDRGAISEGVARVSREKPDASIAIANGIVRGTTAHPLDLYAATVRSSPPTAVKAGENGGRTLRNDAIVRGLFRVARVNGAFEQPLPAGANVVFLQDPATLRIAAAASRP